MTPRLLRAVLAIAVHACSQAAAAIPSCTLSSTVVTLKCK
jgi:hypothetical protein